MKYFLLLMICSCSYFPHTSTTPIKQPIATKIITSPSTPVKIIPTPIVIHTYIDTFIAGNGDTMYFTVYPQKWKIDTLGSGEYGYHF